MMEQAKRVLALLLCAVMLFGMIPPLDLAVTAYAKEGTDFKSEESQSEPATGTPATGTPATGAPATGAPATGAPATGAPATGTPATGCTHEKDTNGYCTVGTCTHGTCCTKAPAPHEHADGNRDGLCDKDGACLHVKDGGYCTVGTCTHGTCCTKAPAPHEHVDTDRNGLCDEDGACLHVKDGGYCTVGTCTHGTCCTKAPAPHEHVDTDRNGLCDEDGACLHVKEDGYCTVGTCTHGTCCTKAPAPHEHVDTDRNGLCDEDGACLHVKDGGYCTVATCGHGSDCCPKKTEEPRYTIVYHSNYGSDETTTYSPLVGDTINLKGAVFSREGYTFQGWSYTPDGEVQHAGGEEVHGGLTQTVGSTVDLYAVWAKNPEPEQPEHVHVDEDGDGFCDGEDRICMHEKDAEGYCTAENCDHGTCCKRVPPHEHVDGNNDGLCDADGACLHVKEKGWCMVVPCHHSSDCCPSKLATYTIVYHGNGGVLASDSGKDQTTSTAANDRPVTLKGSDTFVREGYTFQGWSNGKTTYDGGQVIATGLSSGLDVNLYAVWVKDPEPEQPEHVHVDEDGDGFCDGEDRICMHIADIDGYCMNPDCNHGTCCKRVPPHEHVDADNDGLCDADGACLHEKDAEGYCTVENCEHGTCCKRVPPHEHVDADNDGLCDTDNACLHEKDADGCCTVENCDHGTCCPRPEERIYTIKVTLRFNDGNGKTEELTVSGKAGTTVDLPVLSDRMGYHFDGWALAGAATYARRSGMSQLTITADIPAELTLDAMWKQAEKQSYTVQYLNVADNSPIREAKTVNDATYLSVINSADEVIAIENYKFVSASCENLTITTVATDNVLKLYYAATVQVNFNLEGGHGIVASKTLTVGEPYGDLPNPPQIWKKGYTFVGWFLGREEITSSSIVELNVEHTLRAYWKKIGVCTVTFDSNGHGSFTRAEEVRYGSKCPEPEAPVDSEYAFTGWYTDPDCKHLYDFRRPVTHDMTLYAGWSESFTLTFISNGGTEFGILRVPQNSVVDLRDYEPVRSGYSFCGWYTSRSGGDRNRVTYLKMDSDKTVYAMWKPVDSTNPQTGDSTNLGLAIGILVLSAVGLAAVIVIGKKKRDS